MKKTYLLACCLAGSLAGPSAEAQNAAPAAARFLNPPALPASLPLGYSQGVSIPPGSEWVLLSGQTGQDASGKLVAADFKAQVIQALSNVEAALQAVGCRPDHIVETTLFIVGYDSEKHRQLAEGLAVKGWRITPSSTLVPVPRLAREGTLFEIKVNAVKPGSSDR